MSEPFTGHESGPSEGSSGHHQGRITRGATVFGAATLLSRLLGLGRDMLFAGTFGTGAVFSAFLIAYQIPNMFRKLFGEGALSGAFVPVFAECVHKEGEKEGLRFASTIFTVTGTVLLGVVLIGLAVYQVMQWVVPTEKVLITARLGQVMIPYVFFICLAGLGMGVLNTYNHFAVPALSPALLNIVLIITMLWLIPDSNVLAQAYVVSGAILVGGLLQMGVQVPVLRSRGFHYRPTFDLRNPYLRKVLRVFLPALFSLAVTQVNVVLDSLLSFIRSASAPSELAYANRLLQLPMGIFSVALAAATLPALSKLRAAEKMHEFKVTLSYSIRQVFAVNIPASIGLIILAAPMYALLFEHGRFTADDTAVVSRVLIMYSIGLFAYSANKILIPAFLSLQDSRTPMTLGVVSTLLNLTLNLTIVIASPAWFDRYISAAFATTTAISGIVYFAMLLFFLRRKIGSVRGKEMFVSGLRTAICGLIMGGCVFGALLLTRTFVQGPVLLTRAIRVFFPMGIGLVVYIVAAHMIKSKEVRETVTAFRRKSGD